MRDIVGALRKMRRMLSRRGHRHDDIEDLMQDAFVRLLEYCQTGAAVREPEALLMTTVQRLAINQVRDRHSERYVGEALEKISIVDSAPAAEEVFAATACLERIRKTLDSLGKQTRQVFLMQRLHGYSYAQISQMTGIPVSTIEKHIARAMTALIEARRREQKANEP